MGQIIERYGVPQWLHTQVTVPAGSEIRVESDAFANNTWSRMRLIALTIGNNESTPYSTLGQVPVTDAHPDWASRLLLDVGKSQCSDINLVSGSVSSLCGNPRRQRQMLGAVNMGRTYRFPTPYKMPRDEGLNVRCEHIRSTYEDVEVGEVTPVDVGPVVTDEITFIAKGFFDDGYPGMLAGRADPFDFRRSSTSHLQQGNSVELISADLYNNGKRPLYLTELCFKEMDYVAAQLSAEKPPDYAYWSDGAGMTFAWLVNPTNPTATKWMRQSQPIPTGLLTPQCRNYDGGSMGAMAMWFPPATYLDPKQALSVRLGNMDAVYATKVRVCLIGELEVK